MQFTKKIQNKKYNIVRLNSNDLYNFKFDYIYVEHTNKIHDSGFNIMNIYGYNKNYEDILFCLSECCDVLEFCEFNHNKTAIYDMYWLTTDTPQKNITRYFARDPKTFFSLKLGAYCSSCMINIIKLENDGGNKNE